ncbi:MgtC/SapB family protein [Empedobacter sp. GD03644]|uniref:MgtC/SapB family protein n=1 Tax=Empedobacter sp. GD03644 TaxID=2975358 RepID=UPI002449C241|nr:MgtC/SapB family protein [Empedobacter sp. GD03644]MDH2207457.1 MgtC/SapB family protein [Empedobacter sp. GD03644]
MEEFLAKSVQNDLILICISIIIGVLIGTEREYRNKSAGLRTFILVSFGSCLFTILSIRIGVGNPDRLAANIITGIGFLGAGVIFKDDNKVAGITTATTIWATASLVMCIGAGYVYLGLLGSVIVLIILVGLTYLQNYIDDYHKIKNYTILTKSKEEYEYCQTLFKKFDLKFSVAKQHATDGNVSTTWLVRGKSKQHKMLMKQLLDDKIIKTYQF